jgi:conjugal transfer mating pair stabilization protein TraN
MEHHDGLKAQGFDAMSQNEVASHIYSNEHTRTKVYQNPDSDYLNYAKRLIDSSETVQAGGCVEQPPSCTTKYSIETCDEVAHYAAATCHETLNIAVTKREHTTRRYVNRLGAMNLVHCEGRTNCTPSDEVHVSAQCHSVIVETKYNGYVVGTNHDQTCTNINITIDFKSYPHPGHSVTYDIKVTELVLDEHLDKSNCSEFTDKVTQGMCVFEQGVSCLDANATKVIDGMPITRACWGAQYQYQCVTHSDSTCAPWIEKGCTQTKSTCVKQDFGVCVQYAQTFECAHTVCIPEPDVCMPTLPCTDGSCDTTQNEESHDMAEGASRLGALAGAATDVYTNQVEASMARIFAGTSIKCEHYPLHARDCCTDSGWGDWVLHCPKELQELQRAKADGRAVFVGEYDDWVLDSRTQYVYCMFPTTLSSIVQIQGRGAQLHIPYGTPKAPDCRGITPEELERIQFDQLNLSSLEQEFMSRLSPPDFGGVQNTNQARTEQLNQAGRAYDEVGF